MGITRFDVAMALCVIGWVGCIAVAFVLHDGDWLYGTIGSAIAFFVIGALEDRSRPEPWESGWY